MPRRAPNEHVSTWSAPPIGQRGAEIFYPEVTVSTRATRGQAVAVRVGDVALLQSEGKEPPYVAMVERFWEQAGGPKMMRVRWFFRRRDLARTQLTPEQMPPLRGLSRADAAAARPEDLELYLSNQRDDNEVFSLLRRTETLWAPERSTAELTSAEFACGYLFDALKKATPQSSMESFFVKLHQRVVPPTLPSSIKPFGGRGGPEPHGAAAAAASHETGDPGDADGGRRDGPGEALASRAPVLRPRLGSSRAASLAASDIRIGGAYQARIPELGAEETADGEATDLTSLGAATPLWAPSPDRSEEGAERVGEFVARARALLLARARHGANEAGAPGPAPPASGATGASAPDTAVRPSATVADRGSDPTAGDASGAPAKPSPTVRAEEPGIIAMRGDGFEARALPTLLPRPAPGFARVRR